MPRKNETSSRLLLRILEESNSTESSSASARSALGYVQDNILRDVLLASFILIGFIFLIVAMVLLLKYFFRKMPPVLQKAIMSVKGKLMWSAVLRWSTQTYLAMAIGVFTSVRAFSKATLITKITAPFQLIYLLIWPSLIFLILYKNRQQLNLPQTKASIGTLYMQFDTSKQSCLHFTALFLYRRLLFAIVIVLIDFQVVLQLAQTSMSGLALLTYIIMWQPMESRLFNNLAVFNELMLLLFGYQMYLFTDFIPVPETRYFFGKILLYLLYFNVAVNLVALAFEISGRAVKNIKQMLKIRA